MFRKRTEKVVNLEPDSDADFDDIDIDIETFRCPAKLIAFIKEWRTYPKNTTVPITSTLNPTPEFCSTSNVTTALAATLTHTRT